MFTKTSPSQIGKPCIYIYLAKSCRIIGVLLNGLLTPELNDTFVYINLRRCCKRNQKPCRFFHYSRDNSIISQRCESMTSMLNRTVAPLKSERWGLFDPYVHVIRVKTDDSQVGFDPRCSLVLVYERK